MQRGIGYLGRLKKLEKFSFEAFPQVSIYDAFLLQEEGDEEAANKIFAKTLDFYLDQMQKGVQRQNSLKEIAAIYALQGDTDNAVLWLTKYVDDDNMTIYQLKALVFLIPFATMLDILSLLRVWNLSLL